MMKKSQKATSRTTESLLDDDSKDVVENPREPETACSLRTRPRLTVQRDLRLLFQLTPPISTAPKSGTSFAASEWRIRVRFTAPVRHTGAANNLI